MPGKCIFIIGPELHTPCLEESYSNTEDTSMKISLVRHSKEPRSLLEHQSSDPRRGVPPSLPAIQKLTNSVLDSLICRSHPLKAGWFSTSLDVSMISTSSEYDEMKSQIAINDSLGTLDKFNRLIQLEGGC